VNNYWRRLTGTVIRKVERNVDVPEATTTYRQAVIAECARLVTAIAGATDVPALIAVVTTQNFPSTENNIMGLERFY
jgi:hypothetical protein